MVTNEATFRMKIDTTGFQRGIWDATTVMGNLPLALAGRPPKPRRPYPRNISRLTAREYRADRRRYGREVRAWVKADRIARQRGPRYNLALFAELGRATRGNA